LKKSKTILVLIFVLVFIFLLSFNIFAADEDETEEETEEIITVEQFDPLSADEPNLDEIYSSEYNDYKFITDVYRKNYVLDVDAGIVDVEQGINSMTNAFMYAQRMLVEGAIFLLYQALHFDSYSVFEDVIEDFVPNMHSSVYKVSSLIMFSLIGFYFFKKMLERKQLEFWTGLIKVVIVVVIAYLYFNNPLIVAKQVEKTSNNISALIISNAVTEDYESDMDMDNVESIKEGTARNVANYVWSEYMHKPWRLMEFGNTEIADEYEEEILSHPYGSDPREELIEKIEDNEGLSTKDMVIKRLGFMIMYFIPLVISLFFMMGLCILVIGLQTMGSLMFLLGVIVLIVALIPNFGMETLKKWGYSIIFLAFIKILIVFILMIMIAFNQALFNTAKDNGWFYVLILQLASYFVVYIYRGKIFSIFTSVGDVAFNPKRAFDRISRYGELNPFSNYGQNNGFGGLKKAGGAVGGLAGKGAISLTRKAMKGTSFTGKEIKRTVSDKIDEHKIVKEGLRKNEETKANNYLDKKYNFRKKKLKEFDSDPKNLTKSHKYIDDVGKIDYRKERKNKPFTKKEVEDVIERRKKAKEYLEMRNKKYGSKATSFSVVTPQRVIIQEIKDDNKKDNQRKNTNTKGNNNYRRDYKVIRSEDVHKVRRGYRKVRRRDKDE
jgi:hypothetical protein